MPTRSPPEPDRPGLTRMTTPRKPTASPARPLTRMGSSGRKNGARIAAKSGTGAVRMEASDESTDRSANVIRLNGIAMLMAAITARWPYIRGLRGSSTRDNRTTVHRSVAPTASRRATSVNVPKSSTASLMNR